MKPLHSMPRIPPEHLAAAANLLEFYRESLFRSDGETLMVRVSPFTDFIKLNASSVKVWTRFPPKPPYALLAPSRFRP